MTETTKPFVEPHLGDTPTDLLVEDLIVGTGTEATTGTRATVHYVGVAHSTGEQFDASWDRDEAFTFTVGEGQVIAGWDNGVAGMRVGGRRRLVIPPHLGYGERGAPGAIAPNETLLFVVDLFHVG